MDWNAVPLPARDRALLDRAIALGRQGWGRVHPNPLVGCLVVQGDAVVGEGWHAEFGGPHAEVVALEAAGASARGGEVFVSLEPCRHQGKTGPCTEALLAAGVTRVVFGARDPWEESGGGAERLREAGIEVVGPALTPDEGRRENPFFFHTVANRPWVALKLALSLDGGIARLEGERTQLSGNEATREVHRLRAGFDGILVGTRTALVDDPALTARGSVQPRVPPRRIVLDAKGKIEAGARAFQSAGEPWILTTAAAPKGWRNSVARGGGILIECASTAEGRIALPEALRMLRDRGVRSLLCEGGGALGSALLADGVVDRLYFVVAPTFLGPDAVPAFPRGFEGKGLRERGCVDWSFIEAPRQLGADLWLVLERKYQGQTSREGEG